MKLRPSILFVTTLFSVVAVLGIPTYDERNPVNPNETAEELFLRVMADCKYMTEVGTVGGSETLEEFEP